MEEGTDIPYLKGRDSQLLHELASERFLKALSRLDVAAWEGHRAWYHPLRGLPLLGEHGRLLKDEGRYTFKRVAVFLHVTRSPESLAAELIIYRTMFADINIGKYRTQNFVHGRVILEVATAVSLTPNKLNVRDQFPLRQRPSP